MAQFNSEITSDDKLWGLLAYVLSPLFPILIMVMEDKKGRPFLKAHAAQALILGIITIITSSFCVGILVWFYQIYLGIKAYQGEYVNIPVITDFVKGQGWA